MQTYPEEYRGAYILRRNLLVIALDLLRYYRLVQKADENSFFFSLGFEFYHKCCVYFERLTHRDFFKQLCFLYDYLSSFISRLKVILYDPKLFSEFLD